MAKKAESAGTLKPVGDLGYEAAITELEGIVRGIESGELPLESAMASHTRGRALVQRCRTILDAAEQELESVAVEDLPDAGVSPEESD